MFNIESYVTPILLSYVDKYVRDFKPADAQVSLWAGGVTLHNLVLKADVLQKEVALPFTLVSGRIHELLIQVPWTKIMSEPIVVTINTIECILSMNPPPDETPPQEQPRTQVVEAPPGYMQALVRRIVSNIAVRVHSLIVKYVHDDVVLSLNVKRLAVDSVGTDWEPLFADIDQNQPAIRRLVRLDDLTLCLDKSDSDGKIRFYQEPLLYRCQLDLRVLTRLVSANTRRARSLTIQLRSSRLAWGVTSEQMVLLLRLLRERTFEKIPPPVVKTASVNMVAPLHPTSSNTAEPTRTGSWSEWAWSWLPTWIDREGVEETPAPAAPVPVAFTAHLNLVSLVFKIMETEGSNRKRARGVLELTCTDAVIKSALCSPTLIRVRVGARTISVQSHGKCVCGHIDLNANDEEPTIYLNKVVSENDIPWSWEEGELNEQVVETAVVADEELGEGMETTETENLEKSNVEPRPAIQLHDEGDQFWQKMAPVIYFEYNHDRTPLKDYVNPYDNPPRDFEYSDWIEDSNVKISIRPILITVTTGLLHRLDVLKTVLQEVPSPSDIETSMRTLTVEECEALSENLPQRHTAIDITGLRVRVSPWDHSLVEKPVQPPLVLDLQLPKATVLITGPLYPHRVCSAACQLPQDTGPLWQGANLHVSATVTAVQLGVCTHDTPRPCARADLRFVTHTLLNNAYFGKDSVLFSYNLKIREANLCGSSARLQAAYQVLNSIINGRFSTQLRHSTLAKDALGDEESVAIDMTLEELSVRGYLTSNINTHIVSMHCARATAFHSPTGGVVRQAWLFSAPEAPTTSPYLRVAVQWCNEPGSDSLEYAGLWVEPTAVSFDPLLVAWLSYRSRPKSNKESVPPVPSVRMTPSSQYLRRRVTPPVSQQDISKSSSGRGGSRSGSGAELVHIRPRSQESSSERSERKDIKQPPKVVKPVSQWSDEKLLKLHQRLNRLLITAEVGLTLVYVTSVSVSAVDCATVRDAMERHAESAQRVLVISLGRLSMHSNSQSKHLWQEVRHDRPTLRRPKVEQNVIEDSFPWKMRLADMSCYTLKVTAGTDHLGRDKSASGLKSQLKSSGVPVPRTVLELVTTTITLSVVTKTLQIKSRTKMETKHKHTETKEEDRTKFFTTGVDFKPSSLKEFIRGPVRRKKSSEPEETVAPPDPVPPQTKIKSGPVISLGINLHADTPPILVRLDQDQVQAVSVAVHCVTHIVSLLTRQPLYPKTGFTSFGSSHKSLIRSVSDLDRRLSVSEETSDNHSEQLISIFESRQAHSLDTKLKTFFWFQWVISRATMVVATPEVKLAFVVDDVISTVDLQDHYNQLKIKVASASVRHYKRTGSEEWSPGLLGGRILEVREPTNAKEENHFLAVTITQARISNLPVSWKEELHPKLLEQNSNVDSMWEVYATLAPLEAVLQPDVLDHMLSWLQELAPRALCPVRIDDDRPSTWQWPFCYVSAGGLRLLLTIGEAESNTDDDTLMLVVGKITVNPHPENPIYRQAVNATTDMSWSSPATGLEGRQYEVLVKNLAIRSARFSQLVHEEATESEILKGTGGENPALKWSQPTVSPTITPILHPVDVNCVLAPTVYSSGAVTCGAAGELNLLSDCAIELSASQLSLLLALTKQFTHALRHREGSSLELDEDTSCPYATFLTNLDVSDSSPTANDITLSEALGTEVTKNALDASRSLMFDSGFETVTSHSTYKFRRESSAPLKKSVSIAGMDYSAKASDYFELFITMGTIEISLYAKDDGSKDIAALKPPPGIYKAPAPEPELVNQIKVTVVEEKETSKLDEGKDSLSASRSLTETIRNADVGNTKLEQMHLLPFARKTEGNVPLVHATLQQPNFYYRKRKKQKTIQISLFNAWVGLGAGVTADSWSAVLVTTASGALDPVTEIPPALATLRIELATGGFMTLSSVNPKGTVQLEVERPVLFEVSSDRIRRIKGIVELMQKKLNSKQPVLEQPDENKLHFLYKMRRYIVGNHIESMTIQTGQLGVRGSEGVAGWSALRLQVAAGTRPEKICCRVLVTAALVSAGPPTDCRHVLLQPMMAGALLDAIWEAWRRAEGGQSAKHPTIRVGIDLDRIILDLRPVDLATLSKIHKTLQESLGLKSTSTPEPQSSESVNAENIPRTPSFTPQFTSETSDYYKDDLRSGAFKIISGGQLPMAYQVTLHGSTVAWRYPHPRAITRLVAFPLPGLVEEMECALELYCPLLCRWEVHTYFQLPVAEPREMQLSMTPANAVFALMWRVRACSDTEQSNQPFEFDARKFMPRADPLAGEPVVESDYFRRECPVSAEQMAGALRVDSYFAPRLLPRARLALRLAGLDLHAHNDLPNLHKQASTLEGYYVSRPLMRSHRVLSLKIRDSSAHAVLSASSRILLDTHISSDLIDSATGTMQVLVQEFRVQGTLSLDLEPRLRLRMGDVSVALHVPGVSTLTALTADWLTVYNKHIKNKTETKETIPTNQRVEEVAKYLNGRVSLWVHNRCAVALRVGQEGTDEIVPLSSGASLAYRWSSPTAPKKLRFALASPTADWHWSNSLPFSGSAHVRVEDVYVYVHVTDAGSRRDMYLSGRLVLANVLRHNLMYKVRTRCSEKNAWQTVSSGEMHAESVGLSVLYNADCETVLKVKFTTHDSGWSGDIPLKECRKENVPWLVKVPSAGEVSYTSVWCRVVRGREDARVIATVWPFYILRSHLPLDADVLISSDTGPAQSTIVSPPIIQTATGRGTITHLIAPGTTAARHTLTFQYRNIECPVTREAVPLHYGVTDTSVFEKPSPVSNIEEVVDIIQKWLQKNGKDADSLWPYSLVTGHWPATWSPALLQPRCDVSVRYAAVRAAGGCSLELRLCPVALLANASPVSLTLRAHDATPLCRLEPGVAIAPPSAVVQKPFFISVEMGRETFVSSQLRVCKEEPGRYGNPAPGHVMLDRAADFAIQCNQKVALLTMYYEIKEDINVLGITSTFILINRLNTEILVSAIAIPNEMDTDSVLRPKTFKVVQPTKEGTLQGTPLCRFWVRGRWRGGDAEELRTYLCLALPTLTYPNTTPVPVALGVPPVRRAVALRDESGQSVSVVVSQLRHEARWVVTVSPDPCPQLVVHNRTATMLTIAEPVPGDTPHANVQVVSECPGVRWWCSVEASRLTHYSSPTYCARYPPPAHAPRLPLPALTVGRTTDEGVLDWSQPISIAEGEQLLQLTGGMTIKVRVRTHPHSSLVELQDVDEHDISASDIRRRLIGVFSEVSLTSLSENETTPSKQNNLARISADDKLVNPSSPSQENIENQDPEAVTLMSTDQQTELLSASQVITEEPPRFERPSEEKNSRNTDQVVLTANTERRQDFSDFNNSAITSAVTVARNDSTDLSETSYLLEDVYEKEYSTTSSGWSELERGRCVAGSLAVTLRAAPDVLPLVALHLQRVAVLVHADARRIRTTISISDVQVDNAQYENEQYDFAVVATTRPEAAVVSGERWPPLWGMANEEFNTRCEDARLLVRTCHDKWTVGGKLHNELTEMELRVGPLGLYVEDAYLGAVVELFHLAVPVTTQTSESLALAEFSTLRNPLRLRKLHIYPLNLTLTLHTAVRMYIALDESPLRLSSFSLHDVMTSPERLTHALTVHYLSAAILGAGWVVGGLELLGAPGALAARVGSAGGGVRGVASAAAAALLRSLSAAAGSLARNLDLLAGDHEHARRAAAARRRPPSSLVAGLVAGITNFAINILGAVGGLAHHPLVGVAVGESGSGAAALRRGILGAITKPLSATADLVAYAGHGLLTQTGWDTIPQPRECVSWSVVAGGWRRDCVRWSFRLAELNALAGFDALLDHAPMQLLLTHKFLVLADPDTERIVEMIDFKFCTLGPYQGQIIELHVSHKRNPRLSESRVVIDEDNEYQVSAAAMARVARYTGAEGYTTSEARVMSLLPAPQDTHALHAALAAALQHNAPTHFPFI